MSDKREAALDDDFSISPRIKFVNLRNLFLNVGRQLTTILNSPRIGLYLRGRSSGNWALAVSRSIDDRIIEKVRVINDETSSELKNAIASHQPCLLEEIIDSDSISSVEGENLLVAPLWVEEEVVALLLADFDAFASLSDQHLSQLNLAAEVIKLGIEKEFLTLRIAQLEKRQKSEAVDDRGEVIRSEGIILWLIDREIERTIRHGTRFAVLTARFDNFAHIIAEYGQAISRSCLKEFIDQLNHVVRKCDFLASRKGDQLLCISFEQDQAGAYVLGEKLRHKIKECVLNIAGHKIRSTLSLGISLWPDGNKISAQELIERSEEALRAAMEKGNCVRLWRKDS